MGRKEISLSPAASDATKLLGAQVRQARHDKGWSAAELATRAGVSQRTVLSVEKGEPSVSLGNAFNIAVLAGVPMFQTTDPVELTLMRRRGEDRVALLPSKTYAKRVNRDFDF